MGFRESRGCSEVSRKVVWKYTTPGTPAALSTKVIDESVNLNQARRKEGISASSEIQLVPASISKSIPIVYFVI